jgi:hypothetical protein
VRHCNGLQGLEQVQDEDAASGLVPIVQKPIWRKNTAMPTRQSARPRSVHPEQLTAGVVTFRRSYYLSRQDQSEEASADDEAALIINATIEHITERHKRVLGEPIEIQLLCAQRYGRKSGSETSFFGSVGLRGRNRSALAYLPKGPFWELPKLINEGASLFLLEFSPLWRGHGDLMSLFIGHRKDIDCIQGGVLNCLSAN